MSKKTKAIIAGIVLLLMATGSVFAYLSFFYQPAPVIRDHTQNGQKGPENQSESVADTDEQNIAVFSSGVNMFSPSEAKQINDAIDSYYITNQGLVLQIDSDTPMGTLGVGDIFYLEGDATTPLGETYIGKIISESESNGITTYVVDDPTIDEVFDVLNLDFGKMLSSDNISQIETIEGVTVSLGSNDTSNIEANAPENTDYRITKLSHYVPNQTADSLSVFGKDDLVFTLNLDLLEVFGLNDTEEEGTSKLEGQELLDQRTGKTTYVYRTTTGICYHRESCVCVSRSKYLMSLYDAVAEGFEPCYMCNPPLLMDKESKASFSPSLKLTGKLGVEDIFCDVEFDWDILSGKGINTASVDVSGKIVADIALKSNLDFEFGGKATKLKLPTKCVKVQGLSEKMFPIGFVGYNFTTVVTAVGNQQIQTQTKLFPFTVAVVIYMDASGRVSLAGTASFNYEKEIQYSHVLVKDGQWVDQKNWNPSEGKDKTTLDVELAGDVDLHVGASLMCYIFNLNPLEVSFAKFGFEAEGSLKLSYATDAEPTDDAISLSYYMRLYLKLLEVALKVKVKLNFGPLSVDVPPMELTAIALDYTIFERGVKNQTRYKPGEMSYSILTARDGENYYYKDTNGDLIKERNGYRTTLYSEDFFTICGIDESYIYLLRNNPESAGTHDIYRISKNDGTGKKIVSEVTNCLALDETYIYYVSNFSPDQILRMNRQTLKENTFYNTSGEIRYMEQQGQEFYVAVADDDMFSWLFGDDMKYLLLDKEGRVVTEYGSNPTVPGLLLRQFPTYYEAVKIRSSGYLRGQAEAVYWLSNDRVRYEKAEGISGWNPDNNGIFTTVDSDSGGYKIVMYRAEDGQRVDVTDVQSDQAFFTLCQSSSGSWFFFDQTEDSLILYTMDENFGNKTAIKTFSLSEIPYNLTNCGMTIMADRIYFYTIQDNTTSHVLYRYDII